MKRFRKITTLFTVWAVFVVGATCTQAGCLLVNPFAAASATHPCCAQNKHHSSGGDVPHSCPTCNGTQLSNDTITRSVGHLPVHTALLANVLTLPAPLWQVPDTQGALQICLEIPPPVHQPTLLDLCCAFLT